MQGAVVGQLGSKVTPWQVTATLLKVNASSDQASLIGDTTINFDGSYANFSNLVIDYSGTYKLEFRYV